MATSDFDFLPSRNKLITRAFRIVGAKELGVSLDADELDQGVDVLNSMVSSWQTDMVFLWREKVYTVDPWAISTTSNVIPSDPLFLGITSAQWWDGSEYNNLELIAYREYLRIEDRSTLAGQPTQVTSDPINRTVYLYPINDVAGKLRLVITTKGKDFDTATESGEFTAKWNDALVYGLAARLSDEYQLPLGERDRLKADAASLFDSAKRSDQDRTDSEFVRPAY